MLGDTVASVIELIARMQPRPPMFIGQKSISCLRAFLDGWLYALGDAVEDGDVLDQFTHWVAKRCKVTDSLSWNRVILCHSQDEAHALDTFFVWFSDFLSHSRPADERTHT